MAGNAGSDSSMISVRVTVRRLSMCQLGQRFKRFFLYIGGLLMADVLLAGPDVSLKGKEHAAWHAD